MLYFPLMFSHPISLEIRGGALGGGGTQGAGSSVVVGAAPGSGPLHAIGGTPNFSRPLSLAARGREPGLRAQSSCRGGAAREEGGNSGPAVLRPGRAPTFPPSACCRWQLRRRLKPTLQPLGLPLPPPPSPERVAA